MPLKLATDSPLSEVRSISASDQLGWRSAIASAFVGLRVDSTGLQFQGSVRSVALHGVVISRITASAHRAVRSEKLVNGPHSGGYMLCVQLAGGGRIQQNGLTVALAHGDVSVLDAAEPYELRFDGDFDSIGVMIPYQAIAIAPAAMKTLMLHRIGREDPLARLVADFTRRLVTETVQLDNGTQARLFGNAVDLIDTLWMDQLQRLQRDAIGAPPSVPTEIIRYIEENLSDPTLSPAGIAVGHFMSVRKLHGLFARDGLTVATWIRERRLERCRDDLARLDLREMTISQVAARWGFVNPPHFSQLFRSAFGMTASDYRIRMSKVA